jgi:sulfoxide reductase heme-binding subunit YedZ
MNAWQRLIRGLDKAAGTRVFKVGVFLACAFPITELSYRFWQAFSGAVPDALGTDPNITLLHETGETTLAILLLSLTVTPVRRLFHINRLQNVRRMLGVWSFAYVTIHLSIYLVFDQLCYSLATCDTRAIWNDLLKRPFIFMGQLGFVILLALAITSTNGWQRRLKRNWGRLHKLAYVAAVAGIIHFIWIQKIGFYEPLPWMVWLGVILGVRLWYAVRKRMPRSAPAVERKA